MFYPAGTLMGGINYKPYKIICIKVKSAVLRVVYTSFQGSYFYLLDHEHICHHWISSPESWWPGSWEGVWAQLVETEADAEDVEDKGAEGVHVLGLGGGRGAYKSWQALKMKQESFIYT